MSADGRLRWQCRRGMLELDLLLSAFLQRGVELLDDEQRADFTRLLRLPDQRLLRYLMGLETPKDRRLAALVERIRHSAQPRVES